MLSKSAEERGLYAKTMEVSNAVKLNGLLKKTNSDPELKINLDEIGLVELIFETMRVISLP